jgi:hypothetical protein
MHGGFQIAPSSAGAGQVLRQAVPANACCNFIPQLGGPLAVSFLGASTWRDVEVSIDVAVATGFAFVGVRGQFVRGFFGGGLSVPAGVFLAVSPTSWQLVLDTVTLCGGTGLQPCSTWAPCAPPNCVLQGSLPLNLGNVTRVTVGALGDSVWAKINGVLLPGAANFSLPSSSAANAGAGFAVVGGSFTNIEFDNVAVVETAAFVVTPAVGYVLRGLPCGDPAAEAGSLWTLSPGGENVKSTLSLKSNPNLCLAPSADLGTAVLAACDAAAANQLWIATGSSVLNVASARCLGVTGTFPGSLSVVQLTSCGHLPKNVYWSPNTGFLHTSAQDPLAMVCLGAWIPLSQPPPLQSAAFAVAG